jgi:hypothetical protein
VQISCAPDIGRCALGIGQLFSTPDIRQILCAFDIRQLFCALDIGQIFRAPVQVDFCAPHTGQIFPTPYIGQLNFSLSSGIRYQITPKSLTFFPFIVTFTPSSYNFLCFFTLFPDVF